MWEKGAAAVRCGGGNVKKSWRIKDPSTAAAVSGWGWRSQPEKHLLRPLIEAAIRRIGKVDTVSGIYHAIQSDGSRVEPSLKYRGGNDASGLSIRGQG